MCFLLAAHSRCPVSGDKQGLLWSLAEVAGNVSAALLRDQGSPSPEAGAEPGYLEVGSSTPTGRQAAMARQPTYRPLGLSRPTQPCGRGKGISEQNTRAQRRNLERGRERWGPQDISLFAAVVRKEGRRKKHSRKAFRVRRRGMTWRAESGMPASAAPPFALTRCVLCTELYRVEYCSTVPLAQNSYAGHPLCTAEAQLASSHT